MVQVKDSANVSLEDALEKTGFGKFNWILIILSGAILAAVFLETVGINVILPVAQCDLQMTNQHKGLLGAIGFIGVIVSSHLWGFLADTRGRKKIIVTSLFIAFFITIGSTLTKSYWLMVVLRFWNGFFVSGPSATTFAYLGEFHCLKYRSKVMMLGSFTFGFFCYYNPIFASIIINQDWTFYIEPIDLVFKPWRLFMIVCAIPSVLCGCVMLFMPESPKFTFSQGNEQETLKILQNVYSCNTGKPAESFDVSSLAKDGEFKDQKVKQTNLFNFMWTQTVPLFKHPHLRNTLTVCFIQFCIFNSSNGFWTFFPEITNRIAIWENDASHVSSTVCQILNDTKIITNENAELCVTKLDNTAYQNIFILNSIYCFGWLFLSVIINRTGKLIIITTLLFTCGISGFSLIFVNQPMVSSYLYIVLLAVGLALTVLNASTVELFPTKLRAMALCLSLMSGRIGSVVGSNIIGTLLDNYCAYTFVMPTILLISSGCLAFTIPNISKRNVK
ncbi:synaptic vesicle glycoprotein 2B-like isoform X4 [Bradysia coprophila]|uniref:synaptic vesicle glycoprotein 2B-like isoform X4 n=1 Tax=Bradysia coprophila TaxID=38358 RepID=UPI00187D81AF|nr:synaptic vesicle glycoprotein 2B-like isoform X4 [Bradysia coprophila]